MKRKVWSGVFFLVFVFLASFVYGAIPEEERSALIALYNDTKGHKWNNNSGWKGNNPDPDDGFSEIGSEDNWYGITVSDNHVTWIMLSNNNLDGSIPPELENLSGLKYLYLNANQLSGTIPPELGNLSKLLNLYLSYNQLTGTIPGDFFENLNNLQNLYLDNNDLNGTILNGLVNLQNLQNLELSDNEFTGSIPVGLDNLSNLLSLYLDNNLLKGSIPTELGELSKLKILSLGSNKFTGSIPSGIGNLSNLQALYLNNNFLSGEIPTNLQYLDKLELNYVDIGYNCLCTTDTGLRTWLNDVDPNWETSQSNCTTSDINVSSPNGGEEWIIGYPYDITWTAPGNVCEVKIELSIDGGDNWEPIIPSPPTPNDGSYLWTVPNKPSTNCKIRISEASDGIPRDESDEPFSIISQTYTLNVKSTPETGVEITVNIPDNNGDKDGKTDFYRIYDPGVQVTLTAPGNFNNKQFLKWKVDDIDKSSEPGITVTMSRNHKVEAVYQSPTYILTVTSSPTLGVPITVTPNDKNNKGGGDTEFLRTYDAGTEVTLTAPKKNTNNDPFLYWLIKGEEISSRTTKIDMDNHHTVQAVYESKTYTLSVLSSPDPEVEIKISTVERDEYEKTPFYRTYESGKTVTLTAPLSFQGNNFENWTVTGNEVSHDKTIQVKMVGNLKAVVYYENLNPPGIFVNRTRLNFGYIIGTNVEPEETFIIENNGGGTLNWNLICDDFRVHLNPVSGRNCGVVKVTMNAKGLSKGDFKSIINVRNEVNSNDTVQVEINLRVKNPSQLQNPFGDFATPLDGAAVRSSIPVTGWALGDTGIDRVEIHYEYEEETGMKYIGDANLVEGARPDVEEEYPNYPMNYKAGWGYMMLTNYLPNGGNGTYKIHAIAIDREGQKTNLGTKTIKADNVNAVKPFGAIDTPTQGGEATGSDFVNWGWVLTPQPNNIPIDGSTIDVYVDGFKYGHPTYNIYREDVATLFPGYANSNGAAGYFYLDTTILANGVHTIQWTARDDADNQDGIGSRYFTILNDCDTAAKSKSISSTPASSLSIELSNIPANCFESIRIKKGWERDMEAHEVYPDDYGSVTVEIKEMERLVLILDESVVETEVDGGSGKDIASNRYIGYLVVDNQLKPLPIGSTLDTERGIFYWQPGPGFIGKYRLVFINRSSGVINKKDIIVRIVPKFTKDGWHPQHKKVPVNNGKVE